MTKLLPNSRYGASPLLFVTPSRGSIPSPRSLVEAVQAVVQQVEEDRLRPIVPRTASLAFRPRVILAVLTYCYARQVYCGSEILDYLRRDEAFCKVCQNEFPNLGEMQAFHLQNRSILESCLNAVLRFLVRQKVAMGLVTRANETFIAEEAKRRIIMVTFIASLERTCKNQAFDTASKWRMT